MDYKLPDAVAIPTPEAFPSPSQEGKYPMNKQAVARELVAVARLLAADDVGKRRKALLRAFPAGTQDNGDELRWDKSRGYAGERAIKVTSEKLKGLGFKKSDSSQNMGQGEVVVNDSVWRDDEGNEFSFSSSYGSTADSNRFSMRLKFVGAYKE
jgi:hypothetical protein